jgi:hypothetical protein
MRKNNKRERADIYLVKNDALDVQKSIQLMDMMNLNRNENTSPVTLHQQPDQSITVTNELPGTASTNVEV